MNAGEMDTLVLIQQPTETEGPLGDVVETFDTQVPAYAKVVYLKGRELVDAMQKVAEVDTKFVIWYQTALADMKANSRVVIKATGKVFDILESIPIPGGRPEKIEILAKRRAD